MRISAVVLLIVMVPAAAFSYEWRAPADLRGWQFSNVQSVERMDEGVRVVKLPGNTEFTLTSAEGAYGPVVRVMLRTMTSKTEMACAVRLGGGEIRYKKVPLFDGKKWKEYNCDFSGSLGSRHTVEGLILSFTADSVELREISNGGQSFHDFLLHSGLRARDVNSLFPFMLYGYSLNIWFYALILACGIAGSAVLLLIGKKDIGRHIALWGVICLGCYVLYGVREDYEDFNNMTTTYTDYVTAGPGQKRYHFWSDLIDFSDFIKHNISGMKTSLFFYGDDDTAYLYLKYLLYPLDLVRTGYQVPQGITVFYNADVRAEGRVLVGDGNVVAEGGNILRYGPSSFLYLMP